MLPKHHLHQLIPRRLASALERLRARMWSDLKPVACIFESEGPTRELVERRDVPATPPFHWGKVFHFGRFQLKINGAECAGHPVYLRWMDQAEDPVNTFVIKGDAVAVTQTYPDGTAETAEISVPATQEAR